MHFPVIEIEEKIGYTFRNKSLLKEALTHSSYAHTHGGRDNERLEYLGDSVLQLVVTEWQFLRDEKASEGKMTAERQKLVREEALISAVQALDLDKYLLKTVGKQKISDKTVSSIFEAVVAAIYLDGGYKAAKKFVLEHGNLNAANVSVNHKGELQEFLAKFGEEPIYSNPVKTGKDDSPIFYCSVSAMGESADGEGKTIKQAQSTAAARLLWELQKKGRKTPPKTKKNK